MNRNSIPRRSSSSQRKLCVERLESRAVLAAGFFGGFESIAEISSQHDRPFEFDRPAFVIADVGHLQKEDSRDPQLLNERASERAVEYFGGHFGERPIDIERIELIGNRPTTFAKARLDTPALTSRPVALQTLETTSRILTNTRTVDQAISTITRESESSPNSVPNSNAPWGTTRFSIPIEQGLRDRVENVNANSSELSDGGMIELKTLDRRDEAKSSLRVPENQPWKLNQDTIDQVTQSSEAQPSAPSTDAEIAMMESGDGGMVRVAVATLPKSAVSAHATIDIQLDPNMGRFRTFQLAASAGHDFPNREVGRPAGHETFASVIVNLSPHEQAIEDEDEAIQSPISISPLASVGVAIFGAIMVTAESRKRSASALLGETPQAIVRSNV